jgi:hypothetical protein
MTDDAMSTITQIFTAPDGARIQGACDTCDAYQEIQVVDRGQIMVHVFHDAGCPTLLTMQ